MGQTMLIVDDSRLSRMMIRAIVEKAQPEWTIVEAANGDEALEKVKAGVEVTHATIDYNMPGMDGLTLSEQLLPLIPAAKMALLTANIQDSIRAKAEQVGVGFVQKPITEDKIVQFISG